MLQTRFSPNLNILRLITCHCRALSHGSRGQSQSAYSLTVTNAKTGAAVWTTGKVAGNSSTNIPYAGSALTSDTDYSWSVTWYDANGVAAAPATSTFGTGMYQIADWQSAKWVGGANGVNTLRAEFTINAPVTRARLFISGLGYYKSWLNGQLTDDHVLGQFTTFEQRVLYDVWDVTNLLHEGWLVGLA